LKNIKNDKILGRVMFDIEF